MQSFDDRLIKLFRLKLKTELAINQVHCAVSQQHITLLTAVGRVEDFAACILAINRRRNK